MILARVMRSGSPRMPRHTARRPRHRSRKRPRPRASAARTRSAVGDATSGEVDTSQTRSFGRDDPNAARQRRAMRPRTWRREPGLPWNTKTGSPSGAPIGRSLAWAVAQRRPRSSKGSHELSSTVTLGIAPAARRISSAPGTSQDLRPAQPVSCYHVEQPAEVPMRPIDRVLETILYVDDLATAERTYVASSAWSWIAGRPACSCSSDPATACCSVRATGGEHRSQRPGARREGAGPCLLRGGRARPRRLEGPPGGGWRDDRAGDGLAARRPLVYFRDPPATAWSWPPQNVGATRGRG